MRVLFVEAPAVSFESYVSAFKEAGVQAEAAADPQSALWLLAGGDYRVVVLPLTGVELQWEVVSAALWTRPPARVIALAAGPVDPALRRRAYGAGVWELGELPRHVTRGGGEPVPSLVPAVRRALREAVPAVLLVDDCAEVAEGIGSIIAGEGFRVETAANPAEAVKLMSTAEYALVITETLRAQQDGFEVVREAARLQPGVPVIVFTATLDDETFLRSVELGASACLWKLAEPEDVEREILAVIHPGRKQGYSRT
ncbi:MAG TPA: response regulator [Patescibacteria group bacterium]|jgi:DNA-binding response OmpR family regulator|nr:response regulator [Patescibacteria group bacterium]